MLNQYQISYPNIIMKITLFCNIFLGRGLTVSIQMERSSWKGFGLKNLVGKTRLVKAAFDVGLFMDDSGASTFGKLDGAVQYKVPLILRF